MKSKIGILNLQHTYNYGAVLQAYALETIINSLGHDAQTIDYRPNQGIKQKTKSIIKNIANMGDVFEDFRKSRMNRSEKTKDLNSDFLSNFSSVVVGSDQVWRPRFTQPNALSYFLNNAGENCNRISYAASFGVDEWEHNFSDGLLTKNIISEISKFKAVSVRESSGLEICRATFNINAEHVLDPTLLAGIDIFNEVADSSKDKRSTDLIVYKLDASESFTTAVNEFSKKNKYSMENIYNIYKYIEVETWVKKIRDAKFIITDSYHGVCFCIMFNKNFVCVVNETRGKARLESLLDSLGLSDRLVSSLSDFDLESMIDIDYEFPNKKLEELKAYSKEFLTRNL